VLRENPNKFGLCAQVFYKTNFGNWDYLRPFSCNTRPIPA
jgi:hypothetical protein